MKAQDAIAASRLLAVRRAEREHKIAVLRETAGRIDGVARACLLHLSDLAEHHDRGFPNVLVILPRAEP